MKASHTVLIAGGGIGGLTAALCLAKRGMSVKIFEAAKKFDRHGAGIQISPNALRILDSLDLGTQLRRLAVTPEGIVLRSAYSGKIIETVPLGAKAVARYGVPYLSIHRDDLHQIMASACKEHPGIALNMNRRVDDFTALSNGVSITAASPDKIETIKGRFLIVADGMRSKLRERSMGHESAVHSGYEAWRAMLPAKKVPDFLDLRFIHACFANNSHAVLYPVNSGRHLNMVFVKRSTQVKNPPLQTQISANADVHALRTSLDNWSQQLRQLVEQEVSWSVWPILSIPKLANWGAQSFVAIGDAAHGMVPYAAQGAAMAIEDSEVLAGIIASTPLDTAAGAMANALIVEKFHKARMPRINQVRRLANFNGRLYHMRPPFSHIRDIAIKSLPKDRLLSRQDWLYNWKP